MLQPQSNILLQDIRRHLELAAPNPVALAITPRARERYKEALACLNDTRLISIEVGGSPTDAALIIVITDGPGETREAYASMNAAKNAGIPVVFCVPERRIFDRPPDRRSLGVDYSGMFWLVAQLMSAFNNKGAYCEFGVYDGRTFSLAYHSFKDLCTHFYAFDSFRGIKGSLSEETAYYKDGDYFANFETFVHNMRYANIDPGHITTTKGFFQDTLSGRTSEDYDIGPISVVHIDVDVFVPALLALEFVTPGLLQGAILLFDDYDCLCAANNLGERKALDTWLKNHPDLTVEPYRSYGVAGRAFIVNRR